jgi:hypothetical protein
MALLKSWAEKLLNKSIIFILLLSLAGCTVKSTPVPVLTNYVYIKEVITNYPLWTQKANYISFSYRFYYSRLLEFTNCVLVFSNDCIIIKNEGEASYSFSYSNIDYLKIIFKE